MSAVTPRLVEAVIADPDAWEYIASAAVEQRDAREFGSPDWSLLNRLFLVAAEIGEAGAIHQPAGAGTDTTTPGEK